MRRLVATALLTPALVGSFCSPAAAANEGAMPYRIETCTTTPNGNLFCIVDHGVIVTTFDAAGGDHFISNGRATAISTDTTAERSSASRLVGTSSRRRKRTGHTSSREPSGTRPALQTSTALCARTSHSSTASFGTTTLTSPAVLSPGSTAQR